MGQDPQKVGPLRVSLRTAVPGIPVALQPPSACPVSYILCPTPFQWHWIEQGCLAELRELWLGVPQKSPSQAACLLDTKG